MLDLVGALNNPAHYLHWGWIAVSIPNLVVILIMLVVFALALLLPFPGHGDDE
jgi:hypothetical protein